MKHNRFKIMALLPAALMMLTGCSLKTEEPPQRPVVLAHEEGGIWYLEEKDFSSGVTAGTADTPRRKKRGADSSNGDVSSAASSDEQPSEPSEPEEPSSAQTSDNEEESVGEPIDLSWFDDCVIIGDSLTNGLNLYNDATGCFGNAVFICGASLGWGNSQWDINDPNEVHPFYNGMKVRLEDAAVLTGANKMIIGLGMNDIAVFGIDRAFEYADQFLQKVRDKSGDIEIYLMTVTPMIRSAESSRLSNSMINEYNARLTPFAQEHGCYVLDTWSSLADENGELPYDLCEDPGVLGIHLKAAGDEIMKDYILSHVGREKQ